MYELRLPDGGGGGGIKRESCICGCDDTLCIDFPFDSIFTAEDSGCVDFVGDDDATGEDEIGDDDDDVVGEDECGSTGDELNGAFGMRGNGFVECVPLGERIGFESGREIANCGEEDTEEDGDEDDCM